MGRAGRRFVVLLVAFMAGGGSAQAQGTPPKVREEKPGLFRQAKIRPEAAQKTAQARFPSAAILSGELEVEGGKLIYTFDLQKPGVSGIEEVHVDAMSGVVLSTTHEAPPAPKPGKPMTPPKPQLSTF